MSGNRTDTIRSRRIVLHRCWMHLVMGLGLASGQVTAQEISTKPILMLDSGAHTAIVKKVLFTPDGKELISVSEDKTIRIWDVATGQALRVLHPPIGRGYDGTLYAAAISADGRTLAIGGYGFEGGVTWIYLVALPAGTVQMVLKGHDDVINDLAFSHDGTRVGSASADKTARIWDVASGRCEQVLQGHTKAVYGVSFSPDGTRLATASFDHTGRLWGTHNGQLLAKLEGHDDTLRCLAWSPDGRTVLTGSRDRTIRMWNADGSSRGILATLDNSILSMTFSTDGSRLLATTGGTSSGTNYAHLLDFPQGQKQFTFEQHTNSVHSGILSPDGSLVATAGGDNNEIFVWKTADGRLVHKLVGSGNSLWSCGWSADGQRIAWGTSYSYSGHNMRGPLERTFDLTRLELLGQDPAELARDFSRAAPVRGSLHLEQGDDHHVLVKQADRTLATIELDSNNDGWVRCFSFQAADRVVVGASFSLRLFDARSGERKVNYLGHTGIVWSVAPSPDMRYFLSSGGDQTLRIWDLEHDEPLLSLFFAGNEWIAWTPEGYYAASPGGERLIGWHVNNGGEQMGAYYPAAQFRKSLYRPDVIKLLVRTGNTERALEAADHERGRSSQLTRAAEVLPPEVVINAPNGAQVQIDRPRLEVRASATPRGRDPITAMRLLIDGRPSGEVRRAAEAADAIAVDESWTVMLTPGVHQVTVKAETAKSYGISSPVEVVYGWKESQEELPALYVLAIGVSEYQEKSLRLSYGAIDARGLADVLQKKAAGVYRKVEEKLLLDGEATQRNILRGLEWLRMQMTQRDVGVVFFAGHGAKDDQGLFYLMPADCTSAELAIAGIGEDQIKRFCQSIPGRLMLLLDACHTGSLGGDKRRAISGLTDNLVRDLVTDDYGVVVMCSSMGREESREEDGWGHGAFTKALIEGIEGKADFNRDRIVYLNELDLYVTDRVKELTTGRQHPVTQKPTTIRSFPLARP